MTPYYPLLAILLLLGFGSIPFRAVAAMPGRPLDGSELPTDNVTELRMALNRLGDSLLGHFQRGDSIALEVVAPDGAWLVMQELVDAAERRGVMVLPVGSVGVPSLTASVGALAVRYGRTSEPDSLERVVTVSLNAVVPTGRAGPSEKGYLVSRLFSTSQTDTVAVADTSFIESGGFAFSHGRPPDVASGGFWSRIVEPVVVIGSAAIMVILLFSVRSQ